jgi:small subunit ribosomal protein S16
MLAIKLQRIGKKHQPSYRFVVAEKRSKMAGPPVEDLGSYNPFTKTASVKKDRISYWMKMGAQPTLSVHNLLVAQGVVSAPKKTVKMKKAVPKAAEVVAEAAAPTAAEAPAAAEATAETEITPSA